MSEYYRKMVEVTEIPAPDDLIQGNYQADLIALATPGEYTRGMLLMTGEGGFVPATAEGLAGATEICILAENITFTDGRVGVSAYFTGIFSQDRIILNWETEGDHHDDLIEQIRPTLRTRGIFMN